MAGDTLYFQIGFKRCGTSAIAVFFNRSGIPCVHHDRGRLARRMRDNLAAGRAPMAGYERYRAFTNMDWFAARDYVDGFKQYPDLLAYYGGRARFILNTRPVEHWIRSLWTHHERRDAAVVREHYLWRYGTTDAAAVTKIWRWEWEKHHARVRAEIPPEQLLVFDIESDSPVRLCEFAGLPPTCARYYSPQNHSLGRLGRLVARCAPLAVKRIVPQSVRLPLKRLLRASIPTRRGSKTSPT